MDKKKLYTVLKAVFWCVIGAFLGSTIYTCWDYHARPGLYALTSAPWYISIVMYGILTAIAAAVLLAAMYHFLPFLWVDMYVERTSYTA